MREEREPLPGTKSVGTALNPRLELEGGSILAPATPTWTHSGECRTLLCLATCAPLLDPESGAGGPPKRD